MPDVESNRELARRIDANDVDWFHERYESGELAWVEKRLGRETYDEIGRRIEAGDLGWVGTMLSTLGMEGFDAAGPLLERTRVVPRVAVVAAPEDGEPEPEPPEPEKKRRKVWLLLPLLVLLAVLAFLLSQCGGSDGPRDLVKTARKNGDLSTWRKAVDAAGLTGTFAGPGPFTIFAPTNEAFDELAPDTLTALLADKDAITKVVDYHVASGALRSADLKSGPLATLEGSPVTIAVADATIKVDAATVGSETVATNGVLHTIDKVLIPPSVNLAAFGRPAITGTADETGAVTLTGRVGSDAARKGIVDPLSAALAGRVKDLLTVDPKAPTTGLAVDLVGRIRQEGADQVRAAFKTLQGIPVNDRLQVVGAPKLETDINALLLAEPIQFDTGSATIRPASRSTLDKLAGLLKATTTGKVLFEGHTDSAGDSAKNLALSQARAEAVKAALVARGVDAARLAAKGYGSERPIADNATPEGRQKNRRVEALVTPS